jgi:hypothetical protein
VEVAVAVDAPAVVEVKAATEVAVEEEIALTLAVKAILAAAQLSSAVKIHSFNAQMQDAAAADRLFLYWDLSAKYMKQYKIGRISV